MTLEVENMAALGVAATVLADAAAYLLHQVPVFA